MQAEDMEQPSVAFVGEQPQNDVFTEDPSSRYFGQPIQNVPTREDDFMRDESMLSHAQQQSNSVVFENVAFVGWQVGGGHLSLVRRGFIFHSPPGAPQEKLKLKIRWKSVVKIKTNKRAEDRYLLKVVTKYNDDLIFEFQSRQTMDNARVRMLLKLEASQKDNDKEGNDDVEPFSAPERTQYTNVGFQGQRGGRLVLDGYTITYINSQGVSTASWEWQNLTKYKINKATHGTPMLRIIDVQNNSFTFQMKNHMDKERVREDIRNRVGGSESLPEEQALAPGPAKPRLSAVLRKSHGSNRREHESVKKTLGSFPRIVGPAADIRELEYISALHQNAEKLLRSDGTISSQDIGPYLSSRYGIEITSEQAIDIAINLCGGKLRNEFAAQLDVQNDKIARGGTHQSVPTEEQSTTEDDEEEEEPIYYFDLVQLMSVLVIPELRQLADRYHGSRSIKKSTKRQRQLWSSISEPISFKMEEEEKKEEDAMTPVETKEARLSNKAVGIVKVVLEALIEIFDEDLQGEIRRGATIDADMLITILESFGDVDTANDPVQVQKLLDALRINGGPPMLKVENFLAALTSDVSTYVPAPTDDDGSAPKTSVFYDVFGWNWDEPMATENPVVSDQVLHMGTASFIDYVADTYRSAWANTMVWCLFILTTLVYLSFFISHLQASEAATVFCPDDEHFGCAIGNKIIGWILTAIFCGTYGLVFILPTSVGNVYGQKGLQWFTLFATAFLAFAPFSTLIWYRRGIPHVIETFVDHRVICPAWVEAPENPDTVAEAVAQEVLATGKLEEDETKGYLSLDPQCLPIVDWCEAHPEVQGKYLDEDPSTLSYSEFETCYNFTKTEVVDIFLLETGRSCNPNNKTDLCPGYGKCARSALSESAPYVCCHGTAIPFADEDAAFDQVCDGQPIDAPCRDDLMCESRLCVNNKCAEEEGSNDAQKKPLGENCDSNHASCTSGFCFQGTCQQHPKWCPILGLEALGGLRLDPYCRTVSDWCSFNNWRTLGLSLFGTAFEEAGLVESSDVNAAEAAEQDAEGVVDEVFHDTGEAGEEAELELDEQLKTECEKFLDAFLDFNEDLQRETTFSFLKRVPATEQNEVEIATIAYNNAIEDTLEDEWTYFILLCIAVVGAFAVLAVVKGLVKAAKGHSRVRDYTIKCAATHKIADVIENALGMHMVEGASTKGQVMRNFFLHGETVVEVGGVPWTLKQLFSRRLFFEEGIRFTGRLWIGLIVQAIVTIVGVAYASALVEMFGHAIDEIRSDLGFRFTKEEILAFSPYEWATVTRDQLTVTEEEQAILDYLPEKWMIDAAGIPAIVVGTLVATFCILVYVPSYTNKVLKLRNGTIPSLKDPYFGTYRNSPDNVVQNVGNMVFSMMGAGVFTALLTFIGVFIFAYPITRVHVVGSIAVAIGIASTIALKIVGQKLLRGRNFSSFYRKKPRAANYASLFFECWYLGTGLLIVISRLIIFIVTGAFWLGRIDVEFLHPNVKIAGVGLDSVPTGFTRDLLVHEAHLHPYIERLGSMYLMRIRDCEKFGSIAGTTWRSLFVTGLMPWIVKYKVNGFDEDSFDAPDD
ncbi:expressed unknown protein [Seminavis robusta]|uniref:Uncharacterized protein n=1 Tax=Seminavis robusta TaxID=568900 RepID=A0A9N8EF39_9STRA|nr:expressed unknown protein [Seminavis robusta]|eukprot:Sro900_g217880.1 n/a (1570) ;mRNA; r:29140-35663